MNTETVGELTLTGVERLHLENCKNDPMVCESSKSKDDLRFALKSIHLENVDVGARTGNSGSILHSSGSSRSALVKRGSDKSSTSKDGVVVAYSTENSDRPAQARFGYSPCCEVSKKVENVITFYHLACIQML